MATGETKPLLSKPESGYGPQYSEHLFQQYRLYVESAEKTSDRRNKANSDFIALSTIFVSLLALASQATFLGNPMLAELVLSAFGFLVSTMYCSLIKSYDQLNTGKFSVIHEIEKGLPLALYDHEWDVLGRGKDPTIYTPLSHIERRIPWLLAAMYAVFTAYFLLSVLGWLPGL